MAFSIIDSVSAVSSNGNDVTTAGIDTTGANLIIVGTAVEGDAVVTDSKSNTWTPLTVESGSFGMAAKLWYAYSPTVGSGHTFTNTLSGGKPGIAVLAVSGSASSPFDQESGGQSAAPEIKPGSVTPTTNDQILVTIVTYYSYGVDTIDSGFTIIEEIAASGGFGDGITMAYKIQTTAGAEDPEWTMDASGQSFPSVIATFKSGAVGGGSILLFVADDMAGMSGGMRGMRG